ncbi:hypothetical protein GCM10027360_09670 [Amycolatopsis echigonensis]
MENSVRAEAVDLQVNRREAAEGSRCAHDKHYRGDDGQHGGRPPDLSLQPHMGGDCNGQPDARRFVDIWLFCRTPSLRSRHEHFPPLPREPAFPYPDKESLSLDEDSIEPGSVVADAVRPRTG